jgi:hypothetical protein
MEVGFRKITGRKVRGWAGRCWMWAWLLLTANMLVPAWLDAGMGGQHLVPPDFALRPGPVVAGLLQKWLVQVIDKA